MLSPTQKRQIEQIIDELDEWGFSELTIRWQDNQIVKINGEKSYKPIRELSTECEEMPRISPITIIKMDLQN